jgi:hypothetical protein
MSARRRITLKNQFNLSAKLDDAKKAQRTQEKIDKLLRLCGLCVSPFVFFVVKNFYS